jgi:predicted esterase YcpF (UPF0227 family)
VIIYLHGFNSGGRSVKAGQLRAMLAPVAVLAPTYPAHRVPDAPRYLRKFIRRLRRENPQDKKLLLIGSSLGGFWAQHLAPEFGAGQVLINPALRPDEALLDAAGPQRNEATGEHYVLTAAEVRALGAYRKTRCEPSVPSLLLLDQADESLDYRVAQAFYRDCGKTLVYPGGNHRFEHLAEALPDIRELYASL